MRHDSQPHHLRLTRRGQLAAYLACGATTIAGAAIVCAAAQILAGGR